MTRMLWKEWYEHRWLALVWALMVIPLGVLMPHAFTGAGQCIPTVGGLLSCWTTSGPDDALAAAFMRGALAPLPLIVLALNLGVTAYASELTEGRAIFLHARSVSWKTVLASKLMLALSLIVVPAVLAVLGNLAIMPAVYRPFVSTADVLAVIWAFVWPALVAYGIGLGASVVLPGIAGGWVALGALGLLALAEFILVANLTHVGLFFSAGGMAAVPALLILLVLGVALIGAMLMAAVRLMRFGITLPREERVKRYALVYVVANLLVLTVGLSAVQLRPGPWPVNTEKNFVRLSPQMQYAYVNYCPKFKYVPVSDRVNDAAVIRVADDRRVATLLRKVDTNRLKGNVPLYLEYWINETTLVCSDGDNGHTSEWVYFIDGTPSSLPLKDVKSIVRRFENGGMQPAVSPDGRWCVLELPGIGGQYRSGVGLLDLQQRRMLRVHVDPANYQWFSMAWGKDNSISVRVRGNNRLAEAVTFRLADLLAGAVDITPEERVGKRNRWSGWHVGFEAGAICGPGAGSPPSPTGARAVGPIFVALI